MTTLATAGRITAVPALMDAVDPAATPARIAVDHVESVTNRECQQMVTEFVLRLPPGWQVAMASRQILPLPIPRLRLQARVLEITARDLAMTVEEARQLLAGTNGGRGAAGVPELVGRTEGWPIGLYLAGG